MPREPEDWGGEVHMPRWMRRLLRRPADTEDTPQKRGEPRRPERLRSPLDRGHGSAQIYFNEDPSEERRRDRGR
jgi:hypothetical protein